MFAQSSLNLALLLLAGLALAAALPAQTTDKPQFPRPITTITDEDIEDSPWFSFPLFGNLFAPLWRLFPSFADIGPRIVADDDKFQVVVNVKDYKKEDVKVKVKGDFIFVQGSHEAKHDNKDLFASQFFHTYTLPVNASGDEVGAELSSDGFLVVTAPIGSPAERSKNIDREVPIKETGEPYQPPKEAQKETEKTEAPTSESDRKEPTTPPVAIDREEITEKDNSIPHGNEIVPL